jgi:hypothetical protein
MKLDKNKQQSVKIPKAFRDTLIELAEGLLPYYKIKIPFWDEKERRILEGYTPSDAEIQNFALQMQPTYLTLKWTAFHPASWFFSQETMLNAIHNPMFYTIDYVFQTLLPGRDLKGILETLKKPSARIHKEITDRHKLAVTGFNGLFFLSQKYFEKLNREAYGRKIFDHFNHPRKRYHGKHPLQSLAQQVRYAKKNRRIADAIDIKNEGEALSITYEAIWRYIQGRFKEKRVMDDYLPPKLPQGPIRQFYQRIIDSIEEQDKEMMYVQQDAVMGQFRVLNQEVFKTLYNAYEKPRYVNLPRYTRVVLKEKYLAEESVSYFKEKKFQAWLREKKMLFGQLAECNLDGDVELINQEKFFQESNHWAPKKHIREPEDLLTEIHKHLKKQERKIFNLLQHKYADGVEPPTQEELAKELKLDRKTVRKHLKHITAIAAHLKDNPS